MNRISEGEWLQFCTDVSGATFFHTPHWANLFCRWQPSRYRTATGILEFSDGVRVLLPMVKKRHLGGLLTIGLSMPGGTFGGPLANRDLTAQQESAVIREMGRNTNYIIRENPYLPFRHEFPSGTVYNDPTQTVDCSVGYDDVWKRATAAHRNAVRNAIRAGVEISVAEQQSDWDAYYSLYEASIKRWQGRNTFSGVCYDRNFFSLIESLSPAFRRLYLARIEGKVIAGILCFFWNGHCVVWHGAGITEGFRYHPNNLLYDRSLYYAVKEGLRWFDCNPSGSLKGVYKFKEYFGAQPLDSRVLVRRSPFVRVVDALRRRKV